MTMNGVRLAGIDFVDPNSGFFDFAQPPDFSSAGFSFPDSLPQNQFANNNVNYYGAPGYEPIADKYDIIEISDELIQVFDFLWTEADILEQGFGLAYGSLPRLMPFVYNPVQNQAILDGRYSPVYQSALKALFEKVKQHYEIGTGGVIADDSTQEWFGTIQDLISAAASGDDDDVADAMLQNLQQTIDFPFTTYSTSDLMRLLWFMSNYYNIFSRVFGTGKTFQLYPERDSFWDKLWSGVKKFFPLMVLSRNAFLGLVAVNFADLANKMSAYPDPLALKKTWQDFGGDWNALKNAINNNSDGENITLGDGGATAALIASATPILLAILKIVGVDDDDVDDIQTLVNGAAATECLQYTEVFASFIQSYSLQDLSMDAINNQFSISFPDVPVECVKILNSFTDLTDINPMEFLPGFVPDDLFDVGDDDDDDDDDDLEDSPGGSGSGGGVPDDTGLPDDNDANNSNLSKFLLPVGVLAFILISNK